MCLSQLYTERLCSNCFGMSVSQELRTDQKRVVSQSSCFVQVTLLLMEDGKIIEHLSGVGMLPTQMLLANEQGSLIKWLCLFVFSLPTVQRAQPGKRIG